MWHLKLKFPFKMWNFVDILLTGPQKLLLSFLFDNQVRMCLVFSCSGIPEDVSRDKTLSRK